MDAVNPYQRVVSVLFQLSKLVVRDTSMHSLLSQIANSASELVDGDRCNIMLLDDSRRYLLSKASHGLEPTEEKITFRIGEGLAGWVAEHNQPACLEDVTKDRRYKSLPTQGSPIVSLLCVPLCIRDELIGTMTVSSAQPNKFGKAEEDSLMYLASSVAKDIENSRLYHLAITDPLTRAHNRQYLYQRLPNEIDRARRYSDPLSVIVFDVDHFKKLNDAHGHDAGDFILKKLVALTRACSRDVDDLIRYGGEEFMLMLPKTGLTGAAELAERIRQAVEREPFLWGNLKVQVTISLGVASLLLDGPTDEGLLKRADELLYAAKAAGRNRVCSQAPHELALARGA